MNFAKRQFEIIICRKFPNEFRQMELILDFSGENGMAFSKAQNLLGQEFSQICFDAREAFHLEAFAIAVGTLKAAGQLVLLLSDWANLIAWRDKDSLRWAQQNTPIEAPNFITHFKSCVFRHFPDIQLQENASNIAPFLFQNTAKENFLKIPCAFLPTLAQQQIIRQILQANSELYFLTAKRGRGKSALLGFLANELTKNQRKIYLTAPNKNAAKTLMTFVNNQMEQIEFIAPDELALRLAKNADFAQDSWLFIDEAAMLPLAQLQQFSLYFQHIILSSTIHSYEGTGRGFELKFRENVKRRFSSFELSEPLRWAENDPLEAFVEDLLLLNAEDKLPILPFEKQQNWHFCEISPQHLAKSPQNFYGLLAAAHYRTSPIDLRRLLDGTNQFFYGIKTPGNFAASLWVLAEGNLQDIDLITQIQRGERRPKGNLVPQKLCFAYDCAEICQLRSRRISRIALLPDWQRRGIGSQLIEFMAKNTDVDFLSVSFGYTPKLARFWQQNGFTLLHLGEHLEASSGCYSAIALRGISKQGIEITNKLQARFRRDFPLSQHPLAAQFAPKEITFHLNNDDWQSLVNFSNFHRALSATLPAITRVIAEFGQSALPHCAQFLQTKTLPDTKKNGLKLLRAEIAQFLQKEQQ